MLRFFIGVLARVMKGRTLNIAPEVDSGYLLMLLISNMVNFIRGLVFSRKMVFLGRGVKLLSRKNLHIGKGVVIDEFSKIDALGKEGIKIGTGVYIGRFCLLKVSGTLTDLGKGIFIGNNVGIGDYAHIGGAGGVAIGNDTIIGSYFSVHPENHNFNSHDILIRQQGVNRKGIIVGNNCWIGAKVTLLDGTKIGNGCVVAAGAVVKDEFPDNVIIGGVPARIIKER